MQNAELKRQLALTGSTTRAAHSASQAAEASARALREELGRAKTLLAQVRQQCATDVRKRDLQLQKLKTHLASHQRGSNKGGVVAPSIMITPGSSGRSKSLGASKDKDKETGQGPSVQDVEYSLTQETTEFLTQLSQSLSDENDSLIALVRGTLSALRGLMGMPHNQSQVSRDGYQHTHSPHADDIQEESLQVLPTSIDLLGSDLESLLTRLRDLLTNPTFAPVEEVHVRDEEIHRLREGWQLMEGRWREAVGMMQGWRKRMLDSGDTVNLDDLKMGLNLGEGMGEMSGHAGDNGDAEDLSEGEVGAEREDEDAIVNISEEVEESEETGIPTGPKAKVDLINDRHSHDPILKEGNGNAKLYPPPNLRKVSFQSPIALENVRISTPTYTAEDLSLDELSLSSPPLPRPTPSPQKQPRLRTAASTPTLRTRRSPTRLTVNDKLQRAEAEAQRRRDDKSTPTASKQSRTLPTAQASSSPLVLNPTPAGAARAGSEKTSRRGVPQSTVTSPIKRTGIAGKPQRRRKSTLSPDELAALMGLRAQEDEEEKEKEGLEMEAEEAV